MSVRKLIGMRTIRAAPGRASRRPARGWARPAGLCPAGRPQAGAQRLGAKINQFRLAAVELSIWNRASCVGRRASTPVCLTAADAPTGSWPVPGPRQRRAAVPLAGAPICVPAASALGRTRVTRRVPSQCCRVRIERAWPSIGPAHRSKARPRRWAGASVGQMRLLADEWGRKMAGVDVQRCAASSQLVSRFASEPIAS
jgi:hypothetical protein